MALDRGDQEKRRQKPTVPERTVFIKRSPGFSTRSQGIQPVGSNLQEYLLALDLTIEQLKEGPTLEIGCGGASFNCEATRKGCKVVSIDPRFKSRPNDFESWSFAENLENHFAPPIENLAFEAAYYIQQAEKRRTPDEYPYLYSDHAKSPDPGRIYKNAGDQHDKIIKAMRLFFEDLPSGFKEGRYVGAELPDLPFGSFKDEKSSKAWGKRYGKQWAKHIDKLWNAISNEKVSGKEIQPHADELLSILSELDDSKKPFHRGIAKHTVPAYTPKQNLNLRITSVFEMLRVCQEVRLYPMVPNLYQQDVIFIDFLKTHLSKIGYTVELVEAPLKLQRDINKMLRIYKKEP